MGKPQEPMIADMATLAGALGERTGQLLRVVLSKQGEGFGKVHQPWPKNDRFRWWGPGPNSTCQKNDANS